MARRIGRGGTPLVHGPAHGQVAVDQVMGRGLVGHDVGAGAAGLGAAHPLGQGFGGIGQQERESGGEGKRGDIGGRRIIKKKKRLRFATWKFGSATCARLTTKPAGRVRRSGYDSWKPCGHSYTKIPKY